MAVVLDIYGVAEQGPPVAVIVLDVVPGVEEVPEPRQVFHLDRAVSGRPCHNGRPPGRRLIWHGTKMPGADFSVLFGEVGLVVTAWLF